MSAARAAIPVSRSARNLFQGHELIGGGGGFVLTDGGRADAGFRGEAGDCVTRAIAIATGELYVDVYYALADRCHAAGLRRSARDGIPRSVWHPFLVDLGWTWQPTMIVGASDRVHLRASELPGGTIICRLTKHLVAVIDGVPHDTEDPRRGGTRLVYGYWSAPS